MFFANAKYDWNRFAVKRRTEMPPAGPRAASSFSMSGNRFSAAAGHRRTGPAPCRMLKIWRGGEIVFAIPQMFDAPRPHQGASA